MKVYLDNAATTPVHPRVLEKMLPYFSDTFGNPSSVHSVGNKAKVAIEEARETIAGILGVDAGEIYFTSGGTEGNNFAISGITKTEFTESGRNGIITSRAEHHSVLETIENLERQGFDVKLIPVNPDSTVNINELNAALTSSTSLVSIIHTNNETGAINNLQAIAQLKQKAGFFLHTDLVQSFGKTRIDIKGLGIDSATISAHKIGGPKGAGAVYAKSGTPLSPLIYGGSQERNRRGGTENVAGIVGLAEAAKLQYELFDEHFSKVTGLHQRLLNGITDLNLEGVTPNTGNNFSPYILSLTFSSDIYNNDSEAMLIFLDINGIAASNGAACASGTLKPSHVIEAMGKSTEDAKGTIRFSLSPSNTNEEIDYTIDVIRKLAKNFRK